MVNCIYLCAITAGYFISRPFRIFSGVMGCPHLLHIHQAGLSVNLYLGHLIPEAKSRD